MQYLVHTSGNVVRNEKQTYVVTGKNKEEAIEKATDMFAAEHDVIDATVKTSAPKIRTFWSLLSSLLMFIAVFLSFIRWTEGHKSFSISPNLKTGLFAVAFYAVYLIRFKGLGKILNSPWTDFISAPLTVLTISCLFNTVLYEKFNIFGQPVGGDVLLLFAVIISAFGFKLISVVVLLFVAVYSLVNIGRLSAAMNAGGFVFIFCAAFGLLIKASVEPSFYNMIPATFNTTKMLSRSIRNDFIEARKEMNVLSEGIKSRFNANNKIYTENSNTKVGTK